MNIQENPYIGLRPYTFEDKNKFFGRDEEKQILFDKILANKLTLLFAASGVGKSSLLRAGIIPELMNNNYDVVYFFEWAEQPELSLKQAIIKALKDQQRINDDYQVNLELPLAKFIKIHQLLCEERLIIILDQFEEFFNYARLKEDFKPFIESLSEAIQAHDTTTIFVLSMREDFAMELNAFKSYVSGIFDNFYRLEKLTKQAAQQAILKPLEQVGFKFEENLLENILEDLSRREQIDRYGLEQALQMKDAPLFVEPPHLQIVCSQLWELELNQQDKTIHFKIYEKHGKAQGFLKNHFISKVYQLNRNEQILASAAFDFLVNKHGTKMAYPLNELAKLLRKDEKPLGQTLNKLEQARILRKTERQGHQEQPILWFELYHDVFAKSAYEWNEQFKNKQRRNKVFNIAAAVMGSFAIIGIGTDYYLNTYFQHLRIDPKTNAVELYQGYLNSVDLFKQQRFLAELSFTSEQLESDKRFGKHQLYDNSQLFLNLTEKLPIANRVQAYFEKGEFEKALTLAKDNISKDNEESKQIIRDLVKSRLLESVKLLETIINEQKTIPQVKRNIANAISDFSSGRVVFTPLLINLLKNNNDNRDSRDIDNDSIRYMAIDALGTVQAEGVIPQLIELLNDDDSEIRSRVINALGKLQAKEAIPQLIEFIKGKDNDNEIGRSDAISNAIRVLGQLQAKEAIPLLIGLIKSKNGYFVRLATIHALAQLQAKEAIPLLIELLKDKDDLRSDIISALGKLQAKEVIPQLIEFIKSRNSYLIHSSTINALAQLQAKEAIPQLIEFIKNNNGNLRSSAIDALAQLQVQVKDAIPQFVELLKDNSEYVHISVARALILSKQKESIVELLKLSSHYKWDIQTESTTILNEFKIKRSISTLKQNDKTDFSILPDFLCLKAQILNEESTNETKVAALRMMGQLETEEAAQFIIEHFEEFGVFTIQALGDTKQKIALEFLKKQLKQLERDKKELHQLRERSDLNEEEKARFQALQDQSYLETEVAHSIPKLDPTNEGLKLLEHPFVEVRNGAIFGIGHFSNFNIFNNLLNAFDKTSLNEPIKRFALYRAIDVSLMTLESDAKPEDVEPLNKIKENLPQTTHQHHAIKQRLEWTLNEINYRLKNSFNEFEAIPIKTSKETDD